LSQAIPRETASLNSAKAPVYSLDHLVYKYRQNVRKGMIYCGPVLPAACYRNIPAVVAKTAAFPGAVEIQI